MFDASVRSLLRQPFSSLRVQGPTPPLLLWQVFLSDGGWLLPAVVAFVIAAGIPFDQALEAKKVPACA